MKLAGPAGPSKLSLILKINVLAVPQEHGRHSLSARWRIAI